MGLFDSKTQSEQLTDRWAWNEAYPGISAATQLVNQQMGVPLQFFPGQTYAGQTEAEAQAIEQLKAGAGAYPGMHGQMFDPTMAGFQQAMGAPSAVLGMGLQDVMNNPALTGAADAIQARTMRNLEENIMPQLTASAVGYGGLGGSRAGVAEGIAARGTSDVLAEQLANMYGNAWAQGLGAETTRYGQALGAQQGAMAMAPELAEFGLAGYTRPAALLGQAGGLERAEEQRAIDEDMARFQFQQTEPYTRAGMGLDLLMPQGVAFGGGLQKGETQNQPSTFSNIGSALGVAGGLGSALFGMGGMFPGFGGFGASGGYGMGPFGYGMGYGINPYGQQAQMLGQQW